jgi:hypothetical protein
MSETYKIEIECYLTVNSITKQQSNKATKQYNNTAI